MNSTTHPPELRNRDRRAPLLTWIKGSWWGSFLGRSHWRSRQTVSQSRTASRPLSRPAVAARVVKLLASHRPPPPSRSSHAATGGMAASSFQQVEFEARRPFLRLGHNHKSARTLAQVSAAKRQGKRTAGRMSHQAIHVLAKTAPPRAAHPGFGQGQFQNAFGVRATRYTCAYYSHGNTLPPG